MKAFQKALLFSGVCCAFLASCAKQAEVEPAPEEATQTITATVKLPEESTTKILYSEVDGTEKNSGLSSVWEDGDKIEAITDAGQRVTFVLVSGAGTTEAIFQAQTNGITDETRWQAVIGSHVSDAGTAVNCTYLDQDGTVGNLGNYDFRVTEGTGTQPEFDFSDSAPCYTYFLRIKLPAGIKSIEYNADAYWAVTKNAVSDKYYNNYDQVSTITLPSVSAAGDVVYVAVSATKHHDYITSNQKGVIFTFFNDGKTKSYGKVLSSSLIDKGGKIGTLDVSSMTLIDRVLPENALDFGSVGVVMEKDATVNSYNNLDDYKHTTVVSTKWSPYNLGANFTSPANRGEYVGGCFSWAEINPKTDFTNGGYGYDGNHTVGGLENFANTQVGKMCSYQVNGPSGSGTMKLQHIAGTKYDAARVHWGSDWRMPTIEELMMFTGGSLTKDYGVSGTEVTTATSFTTKNENVNVPGGLTMEGRWFEKNSVRIFFPSAGWNKKATWGDTQYFYSRGLYWSDTRIRATPSNQSLTNQPVSFEFQRNGALMYGKDPDGGLAKDMYRGLYIRPVINSLVSNESLATAPGLIEDGNDVATVYPTSTLYGYITDDSEQPVAGVVVSDGYSCCVSDRFGLYQMKANANAKTVSMTIPAGYELTSSFYQVLGEKVDGKWADKNFTLAARSSTPTRATFVMVTDVHVGENGHLTKFQTSINDINSTISTLKNTGLPVGTPANAPAGEVVVMSLGDNVSDVPTSLNSDVKTKFSSLNAPVFYVIGNHDHNPSSGTADASRSEFISTFAPLNYSFDVANVHVIVMDDIYWRGSGSTISYGAGFSDNQIDWLKADIAKVQNASSKVCVFCVHAPLSDASAGDVGTQDKVMSALKNAFSNVHVFSGHTHVTKNNLYHGWAARSGRPIYEHTLQSLAGYFWDYDVSFTAGSPSGYGVFTFSGDDIYAEYNKVTKMPASFQMRCYDGGATYNKNSAWDDMMHGGSRGYKEYTWDSLVKNKLVVRLNDPGAYDDNDTADYWTVSAYGSNMTRVSTPIKDACVASYVFNKIKGTHGDANGTTTDFWYSSSNYNSSFTVTATHTMKSGWSATFTSTHIVGTDYTGFAYGTQYD